MWNCAVWGGERNKGREAMVGVRGVEDCEVADTQTEIRRTEASAPYLCAEDAALM